MARPEMKPSFDVIVSTYATQAAVALGQIENPITKKKEKDLPQAKFAIDLLQILDEKTKGNRTSEEDKFLADCLYQLRMVYLSLSK
ncbi:MAG TPA: DUF1844 domain-containing protein [Planctomycetota bacterium]|nr:DUF1844 domain-containing protein [Planctomycetota bacterium]